MSFERYRDSVISDFEADLVMEGLLDRPLTDEEKDEIIDEFEAHRKCYENHKEDFDREDLDIIHSTVYGNGENVCIECEQCNEVIIDSVVLFECEE